MKKRTILASALIVLLLFGLLAACASEAPPSAAPAAQEEAPSAAPEGNAFYNEAQSITVEGRSFLLEDLPESEAEALVVKDFLYSITGEFDKKALLLADTETHRIYLVNEERNLREGCHIKSHVIHAVMTLTAEEYAQEQFSDGESNPLYYHNAQALAQEYDLGAYEIVRVEFTVAWSEAALEKGPQWGDGTYSRSFLVGKCSGDNAYKIYEYGMM